MNKKKVLLTVLAMVLVCALSVAGTLALLAENGGTVVNTFVAAGGDGPFVDEDKDGNKLFELKEYEYTQNTDGSYTRGEAVTGDEAKDYVVNDYKVLPGTTIPKEAFVTLSRTAETVDGETVNPAPAYLFIEVKSDLTDVYTWSVAEAWLKLEATGLHGGTVYVLKDTSGEAQVLTAVENGNYPILKDNAISVDKGATSKQIGESVLKMEFYAYLSQSTVANTNGVNTSDPAEVYNICFSASSGN